MRLEDLAIFRVREIEFQKLDFGDKQLVAVLGENGSGKTTLLGSIIFLLSGEVIFKGGKERMVRDVGSGDSWVAGTIRHGDHHFKLKRFVSTSSCELIYLSGSNSKPIKTPTKVQAELDAMGLTVPKVMRTLLEQGKYGGMFHSSDGDRLRLMFEIFGLTDSDEIQDAIGAEAALIPIDVTIDDRWKVAADRRETAETALAAALTQRDALSVAVDMAADAKATLAKAIESDAAATELNKLRGAHGAVAKTAEALFTEVSGLSAEQGVLDAGVVAMTGDAAAAEQVVAAMGAYGALAAALPRHTAASTQAGATIQELRVALLSTVIPDVGAAAKRAEVEVLLGEIAKARTTLATAKRIAEVKVAAVATKAKLGSLGDDLAKIPADIAARCAAVDDDYRMLTEQVTLAKSGVCPTCKQKLPTAHDCMPLEQSEPLLEGCRAHRDKLQASLRQFTATNQVIAVETARLDGLNKQIADAGIGDVDTVALAGTEAAYTATVAKLNAEIDGVAAVLAKRAAIETKLAKAEAEFASAQNAIAAIDAARVDPGLYEQAVVVVDEFKRRKAAAQASRGVLAAQTARLTAARADLAAVETQIKAFRAIDTIDPAAVEQAREIIARTAGIDAQWLAISTNVGVAEAEARSAAQEFSTLDILKKQNEANKKKHELIADMKYLVGVKQFPMFVAGFYVQAVNALWSRELSLVDSTYSAWQDETTLEFYATFHGTDQTRMLYQLSGGERQLASVGYQIVLNKLFAAGVDFIAFDEPTTHVDANYRPKLVQSFTRMLQREDLKDMQIFVVDHSAEFANAISDPIILTKGER